jgi:SAM-dependent methyltransferase
MAHEPTAFDRYAETYDAWFEEHADDYRLELEAVRRLLPACGTGVEIGVGSGRFAAPLGIKVGIEPSAAMRKRAQQRGIEAIEGVAEHLPLETASFDYALFVTTLCFLESLDKAFAETWRILKSGGAVIIGFIDKNSELGRNYQQRKDDSRFYSGAHFHSVDEVLEVLVSKGFGEFSFVQTLLPDDTMTSAAPGVKPGYGEGAFVVVRAVKPASA